MNNSIVLYPCGQQLEDLLNPQIEYCIRSERNADETKFRFRNHNNTHVGIFIPFRPKTTKIPMYQLCKSTYSTSGL
jgi:hypothetical protein